MDTAIPPENPFGPQPLEKDFSFRAAGQAPAPAKPEEQNPFKAQPTERTP